ncbi:hypothetical protein [Halopelagius longus]|uniref:hypothetical protein n=1 Tax=Halopelagius longus TaxID=1236180 RepID=UPI0011135B08|nr:hypothetical protein [Halopelagius longus]
MTYPGRWWIPVLAIPVLFLLWLSVELTNIAFGPSLGGHVSGYLGDAASAIVAVSYALSLFAPFALYHDRRYVSEHSEWTPTLLYLFVFVPLLNVPLASLYLVRRHRVVDTP